MKKLFLSALICGALFACKKEENNPTSPSTPTVEEYLNTSTDASLSINGSTENTTVNIEETASNYIIGVNSSSDNLTITTSGKEVGTYTVGSIFRNEVNIQVSNSDSCNLELLPGGTFEITSVSPDFEFNMNFSYVCGMDTITIGGNVSTGSPTNNPESYITIDGEVVLSDLFFSVNSCPSGSCYGNFYGLSLNTSGNEIPDTSGNIIALTFFANESDYNLYENQNDLSLLENPFFQIVLKTDSMQNLIGQYNVDPNWEDLNDARTVPHNSIQGVFFGDLRNEAYIYEMRIPNSFNEQTISCEISEFEVGAVEIEAEFNLSKEDIIDTGNYTRNHVLKIKHSFFW